MSQHSTAELSLQDRERWVLQVSGRRVPAQAQVAVEQAESLIEQANAIVRQAHLDAQLIRQQAQATGMAAGKAEAIGQMADYLLQAQAAAQSYLVEHEERLLSLAAAMVTRIVQSLPRDRVLNDLLSAALNALQAERYLRVRVHPESADAVQVFLRERSQRGYAMPSWEVMADADLDPLDCLAESEMGTVHAGVQDQLRNLTDAARRARQTEEPIHA